MDRHVAQRILTSILVLQIAGVAHAATTNASSSNWVGLAAPAEPQPIPSYEGIGKIADITRQTGGDTYRLDLAKALPLTSLKAKPKTGRVKIISVTLVTDKKDRIPVKAMTNVVLADTNPALVSEALSPDTSVAVIEVQAEAMGGAASLDINAISNKEVPQLALREELSCSKKADTVLKDKLDVVQLWASRIEASTQGSWQEKYAIKEFNKYVTDFITTLKAGQTSYASTEYTLTLLNFFTERHNASRVDSAIEAAYKTMTTETFDVFLASLQVDDTCRVVSSEGLINIALDFQKRYEAGKPDSRGRKLYEMMISKLGKFIPTQYRKELATKNYNFRQADAEGYKYYKLFSASKHESLLKSTHTEMSTNAYAVAEKALAREVKDMDNEKTYQLIVEFQTKYNDAANYPQDMMMKYLMVLSEHSIFLRDGK